MLKLTKESLSEKANFGYRHIRSEFFAERKLNFFAKNAGRLKMDFRAKRLHRPTENIWGSIVQTCPGSVDEPVNRRDYVVLQGKVKGDRHVFGGHH
jgi:hypothetical protein